jgi:arsenite methyltransferase
VGKVVFGDISQDLLDHVRDIAQQMAVIDRSEFLNAPADDLSALADSSVDVVTTRSVLIYVAAKEAAFKEFYRVLKPGGRLSIFEPINRFAYPEPSDRFCGYDVSEITDIVQKVKVVFARIQPADTDPMLNFDERDLIALAEKAGFREIHLELTADITQPEANSTWDEFLNTAGNPKIPTIAEAVQQALTPEEAAALTTHLRPLVEARQGVERSALAYLWAVKN